jgi:hypothetical protein
VLVVRQKPKDATKIDQQRGSSIAIQKLLLAECHTELKQELEKFDPDGVIGRRSVRHDANSSLVLWTLIVGFLVWVIVIRIGCLVILVALTGALIRPMLRDVASVGR